MHQCFLLRNSFPVQVAQSHTIVAAIAAQVQGVFKFVTCDMMIEVFNLKFTNDSESDYHILRFDIPARGSSYRSGNKGFYMFAKTYFNESTGLQ